MQAIALPAEMKARFRASVHHQPQDRAITREWLARAMEGVKVDVLPGFEKVEPFPKHTAPARTTTSKRKANPSGYVRPPVMTEDLVKLAGDCAAASKLLGLTSNTVRLWGTYVPATQEAKARELIKKWPKLHLIRELHDEGLSTIIISRKLEIDLEEMLDLCSRFNIKTNAS